MILYVGDDWSEDHHDVQLMNEAGERLAARRLPEGVTGVATLHELIAQHASDPGEVVIGIETERGPWVSALLAAGHRVYAINPRSAARYRDRHRLSGAKSDAGDAKLLADLVRTDRHNHRPVAGDSDDAGAVRILARAHQQLIWDRTRQTNRLAARCASTSRAHWRRFPSSRTVTRWGCWRRRQARVRRRLTITQIRAALRRGGRQRSIEQRAAAVRAALRSPQLGARPALSRAFAASTSSAIALIVRSTVRSRSSRPSSRAMLSSTRTPKSTAPCPVSVSSSAPGCSESSGTTPNATSRRSPAGTTPVPRR